MSASGLLRKDQLERSLHDEKKLIEEGILKEDNPLDFSENFQKLCAACRRGDLKVCQELIQEGVNINAKDQYDYTPLILASLCGHYEVVQLLLESGALCERDTFQGERCLYNALNDRIRNLLLQYDYSKSTDPLQPLASHLVSLLTREHPKTSDITVSTSTESFHLHKFILSARSPYFRSKLAAAPETTTWKLPPTIPPPSFGIALKHLYLGELPREPGGGPGTGYTDSEVLAGVDRISKHLEIQSLSHLILDSSDRRLARQRRQDEVEKGRDQLELWFRENVLKHAIETDTTRADSIKWDRDNGVFADILLRADADEVQDQDDNQINEDGGVRRQRRFAEDSSQQSPPTNVLGIPLDRGSGSTSTSLSPSPSQTSSRSPSRSSPRSRPRRTKIYPCHKAMLIRSEFFMTMFDSSFREAQETPHLQIVPIDCSPEVLEIILTFLYTERADFGLDVAVDVLFAADMLFLEKLKAKAAVVISTLGNGTATAMPSEAEPGREDVDLDIYEILRAAWLTRVQRLEEFAARYIAYRLESYIDDPGFAELVSESAARISARQETDSIELLDDIRYYLSERFRLRFEDSGLEDVMDEDQAILAQQEQQRQQHEQEAVAVSDTTEKKISSAPVSLPYRDAVHRFPDGDQQHVQPPVDDEGVDMTAPPEKSDAAAATAVFVPSEAMLPAGAVRTLDGKVAGDEFAADAVNYQILLNKIDALLERLKLDA
ncbi:hypothetical protein HRR83_002106 [Exophiala dermatitidis]|uniref:BTB domain-containing protein n=1 Tax=Exophiala dermatitidis TaxID=5970 RepID=A0AAN6IVY2_EXODE|nr:hypothetical protein HRR75_002005 [Exophiala dermatitidis]KAJ4523988.1 hypothetical protein HRR74_002183 [Exophiala dermatitidis]KAJ4525742.1 hypothetical protein HRR73_002474 [Exophiala dermatitidis]KAJ4537069.1 hypothetical protein HRR76_005086 [Exophiala dermatitidis]KAJ4555334.1 hypothetical protein HRR77_001270 [Exophiala dermatitidis]